MFKVSYKVTSRGAEWIQVVRFLDLPTESAAVRRGRSLIKKLWPSARVRVRSVWRMHSVR